MSFWPTFANSAINKGDPVNHQLNKFWFYMLAYCMKIDVVRFDSFAVQAMNTLAESP